MPYLHLEAFKEEGVSIMVKRRNSNTKKVATPPNYDKNRIFAVVIDWLVGGVVSGLPAVITFAQLTGSSKPVKDLYIFEALGYGKVWTIGVALCCVMVGFFYYVIIPWKIWPGQTLGKKITNLKIVKLDESIPNFLDYFIRNFVFLFFVEGVATPMSMYIKVLITTMTRVYVDNYLSWIWNIITLVSLAILIYSKRHLAVHDLVTQTKVISWKGDKQLVRQSN